MNPFPDRARTLKLWISEDSGPDAVLESAITAAPHFGITDADHAKAIVSEVVAAVKQWRDVSRSAAIRMTPTEIDQFEEAFEHEEMRKAERFTSTTFSRMPPPDGDSRAAAKRSPRSHR